MLDGRSVVDLIGELVVILNVNYNEIRLCVRAGLYGRLTPLVINLPDSEETMDIVIFTTGSPGENYIFRFLSTIFRDVM